MTENPYQPPRTIDDSSPLVDPLEVPDLGGIGRMQYVGLSIAVAALFVVPALVFSGGGWVLFLVGGHVAGIIPAWLRYKNIGKERWRSVLMLFPLINLNTIDNCTRLPPGYAKTGVLDRAGRIMSVVWLVFYVMLVGGIGVLAVIVTVSQVAGF